MQKTIVVLSILTGIIGCHKKSMPVITERKYEAPKTTVTSYPPTGTIAPDTTAGKIDFTNCCGKCHGLPEPLQYTAQRWDGILSYMIPRARLSNEQAVHVTAYVKANAQK
jgi:hypothetical protein